MTIQETMSIVGTAIVSIGGGSAIVIGVSSWLGRIWADRLLEMTKRDFAEDLEAYKAELANELSMKGAYRERGLYISKVQYDNEQAVYREIWPKLIDCYRDSLALYPQVIENVPVDEEERRKYEVDKYRAFAESCNAFVTAVHVNAPFYKKEFYDEFLVMRAKCGRLGMLFKNYNIDRFNSLSLVAVRDTMALTADEAREVYTTIPKELDERKDALQGNIREYLLSLRIIE